MMVINAPTVKQSNSKTIEKPTKDSNQHCTKTSTPSLINHRGTLGAVNVTLGTAI